MPEINDQNPIQELDINQDPKVLGGASNLIINSEYNQKIHKFKRRIIFNACTSIFFIIFIVATVLYSGYLAENNTSDINYLNSKISELRNKSSNIESRVNDVKKYKQIWMKVSEKKKDFIGIKIVDFSNDFENLAKKYNLSVPTISLSPPEILKDSVYNRPTLEVQLVTGAITFNALTDRIAMDFVNEFTSSLPGYIVVHNISIKKSKKEGYSESELMDISVGKFSGIANTKLDFAWYSLKNKAQPTTQVADEVKK